jgi:hypothetical protein
MGTQLLPVKLENDELLIRGHELADACADLDDIETRKKCAMSAFKDEIEAAESNVSRLSRIVKDRAEYREVEVKEVRNEERMTMDTIRLDSGETVSYRALQGHERNLTLFPAAVAETESAG